MKNLMMKVIWTKKVLKLKDIKLLQNSKNYQIGIFKDKENLKEKCKKIRLRLLEALQKENKKK